MLAITGPVSVLALVPVVLLEAYVFKRHDFRFGRSLKWSAGANAVSTIVGVPVAWFILVVLSSAVGAGVYSLGFFHHLEAIPGAIFDFLVHFPWLPPTDSEDYYAWAIPAAFLILLVPFFWVSWQIEYRLIASWAKDADPRQIRRASLHANFASYVLLALYPIWTLVSAHR